MTTSIIAVARAPFPAIIPEVTMLCNRAATSQRFSHLPVPYLPQGTFDVIPVRYHSFLPWAQFDGVKGQERCQLEPTTVDALRSRSTLT